MDQIDSHVRRLEQNGNPMHSICNSDQLLLDIWHFLSFYYDNHCRNWNRYVCFRNKQTAFCYRAAPANNESANKKKSVRISESRITSKPFARSVCFGCHQFKIQSLLQNQIQSNQETPWSQSDYQAYRMILTNIYHPQYRLVYSPCDMEQIINPKPVKKVMTIQNAIEFLLISRI